MNLYAHKLGKHKGKTYCRYPVKVRCNEPLGNVDAWLNPKEGIFNVIAASPNDAANFIRDKFATIACTEIFAYGPKGGVTSRYIGWESAIGYAIFASRPATEQLTLSFIR